jgi:UDP-N-acetylglucosamine 1-carboxyvinyltransferase
MGMDKIVVEGGRQLKGRVQISGAKNAALPLLASTILTEGWNTFKNIPQLRDVDTIKKLLVTLGVCLKETEEDLQIDASSVGGFEAPYELVKTMRASILVLGPLLARMQKARVSLPGGCAIGARPINLHLMGLEKMGAEISLDQGYVDARGRLKGAEITFDQPTVTGTENLLMAATLAHGSTILHNAAREPEVVDLADVLIKMGAHIEGAGTEHIKVEGVERLHPVQHSILPDRIEAGTFMIAAAITGGRVFVENAHPEHLQALLDKLDAVGLTVEVNPDGITVARNGSLTSVDVKTAPFPGFPTDMQAQFMALMCIAPGLSVITENVFENRFMHVGELRRMGAEVDVVGRNAVIKGVKKLGGAPVMATDLRASASLILAGLIAEGTTEISRIYHIDRGYQAIEKKLSALGAQIERVKV